MAIAGTIKKIVLTNIQDSEDASDPTQIQLDSVVYVQGNLTDIARTLAIVNPNGSAADLAEVLTMTEEELYDLATGA